MTRWILAGILASAPVSLAAQGPGSELATIVSMVEEGRLAAAEDELRRMLATSDTPEAADLLGIVLVRTGRAEEAEERFRSAIRGAPEALPPRQHLARLLLQQRREDEAFAELRTAARLGPLERPLALWLAEAGLARGDEALALAQLESVAERFGSVRAMMELARVQAGSGREAAAFETLQRAREIAPNSGEVLAALAQVSLTLRAPVPAIGALEALCRMDPEEADPLYLLGVARMQVGEMGAAIDALERSLVLAPERPKAWLALGRVLTAQKRFSEAKEALRKSLRLQPESLDTLAVLAEAEEGLGELEQAEEHATRVLERDADHPGALLTLGLIRMTERRFEEARDALLRAVAREPELAKAHYQLSLAFARLGDRESSAEHLELYRTLRKSSDERLIELRQGTKPGDGGAGSS